MPMEFMELLTNIPNEQEIRVVTDEEKILYAGKCGEMPFSVVREANDMMVISVMASGDNLCVLLEGPEEIEFDFGDDDLDGEVPFD